MEQNTQRITLKIKNTITRFLKNLVYFIIFLFLLVASLYGATTPQNKPIKAIGTMQIAPFKDGISIYQGHTGEYYVFSPFNDYAINEDQTRSSYISTQELTDNKFKSTFKEFHLIEIKKTIEGYLGTINPSINFRTQKNIKYSTNINKNRLTINTDISFPDNNSVPRILGSTISYQGTDFIFDTKGNLYNYLSDNDISSFKNIYKIHLASSLDELRIHIPDGKIIIVNPHMTGVIVIRSQKGQNLWVNRNFRLIEVEKMITPKDDRYTTTLHVEVYKNLEEAQKTL